MDRRELNEEELRRADEEKDAELRRRAKEDPGADFTRKSQIESLNYFEEPGKTPPMDDEKAEQTREKRRKKHTDQ